MGVDGKLFFNDIRGEVVAILGDMRRASEEQDDFVKHKIFRHGLSRIFDYIPNLYFDYLEKESGGVVDDDAFNLFNLDLSKISEDIMSNVTADPSDSGRGGRLADLNKEFEGIFKDKLPENVKIIFDLPQDCDPKNVTDPTISIFLYDIHEEVEMRHSESGSYNRSSQKFDPGIVRVRCCYLITCWQPGSGSTDAKATDSVALADIILRVLVNRRTLPGMPEAYCRVLPPTEQLKSLGSFWQALGNRPRLSMSYLVTIPIPLRSDTAVVHSVLPANMSLTMGGGAPIPDERMKRAKTLVELIDVIVGGDAEAKERALSDVCHIVLGKDVRFGSNVNEINAVLPADAAVFIAARASDKFKTAADYTRMLTTLKAAVGTYKAKGPMAAEFAEKAEKVFLLNLEKYTPKPV